MTDKTTRDMMRHDALLEQTASAADFAAHHTRSLIGAAAVVVVVALGLVFFQSSHKKSEERAAELLYNAQYEYDQGNMAAAATELDELERNLGGTTSGKIGLCLAGNVHASQGQWEQALEDFETALEKHGSDPLLSRTAARGRATALEALGRHQEAAAAYQSLADQTSVEATRAGLLYLAARNLAAAGSVPEAKTLYEEVSHSQGDPRTAQQASLRLAELEVASS